MLVADQYSCQHLRLVEPERLTVSAFCFDGAPSVRRKRLALFSFRRRLLENVRTRPLKVCGRALIVISSRKCSIKKIVARKYSLQQNRSTQFYLSPQIAAAKIILRPNSLQYTRVCIYTTSNSVQLVIKRGSWSF